jgi:hypothetical protein
LIKKATLFRHVNALSPFAAFFLHLSGKFSHRE